MVDAVIASISFIPFEDKDGGRLVTRAWDGIIPNRILIYCM